MESVESVLSIVQNSEANWLKVTAESCKLTRLVSNSSRVFMIDTSLPIAPKKFIFRLFGCADTLDLDSSSAIFSRLAARKMAPKIYVETPVYRLEEFLEETRNLQRAELVTEKIGMKIAKKLREFHSIDLSDILNSHSIVCISNSIKWKKLAETKTFELLNCQRKDEMNRAYDAASDKFYDMYFDILPKESPVVLAHMDTSFLNILYKEDKEEVCLIDFDYTGYCYRAFDIAMLLLDIKYDYNYPEYPFYRYCPEIYPGDEILATYVKAYGEGVDMFVECKRCMIASHYLWAMWAFSLVSESTDGMDMLGYGLLRFNEFLEGYEEFKNMGIENVRRQAAQYFS